MGDHVSAFAAISSTVQDRIKRFWDKDSMIIHPPVDLHKILHDSSRKESVTSFANYEYLVSAGRFVNYKNHDLAITIAAELGMPIVVMGSGPNELSLRKLANKLGCEIEFIIRPSRTEWLEVLDKARCLLFPVHEDFGITPIEAINTGTPVIAKDEGGARDYILTEVNGVLLPTFDKDRVHVALKTVDKLSRAKLPETVQIFGEENFQKNFKNWVQENI